jgi:hypothetical protein
MRTITHSKIYKSLDSEVMAALNELADHTEDFAKQLDRIFPGGFTFPEQKVIRKRVKEIRGMLSPFSGPL